MRRLLVAWSLVMFLAVGTMLADETAVSEVAPTASPRPQWTNSKVIGSPDPPRPYTVRRVFAQLPLTHPIHLASEPGTENYFVVEHGEGWHGPSRLFRFVNRENTTEKSPLFETRDLIYAVAFHPRYVENGELFLFTNYRSRDFREIEASRDRIQRFRVQRQPPFEFNSIEPENILEWWSNGHDGGGMAFGVDGTLYIALSWRGQT